MNPLVTPIILLVLSAGLFFTFTDKQYEHVKELKQNALEYDKAIKNSNDLLKSRDRVLLEYKAFPLENMKRVERLIPDNVDNVRLIIDINGITSKYGVAVKNVRLDTINNSEKKQVITSDDGKPYHSATVSFSVNAKYETFLQILKDIESSLRILDVESVSFVSADNPAQGVPADVYQFDVTLRTYWMK